MKSSAFGDISPDKIVSPILLSHKIVSIDNKDKTYQRIKELADADDRSFSQYINMILKEHVQPQDSTNEEK